MSWLFFYFLAHLLNLGWGLVTTILHLFMVGLVQLNENVTKWGLILSLIFIECLIPLVTQGLIFFFFFFSTFFSLEGHVYQEFFQ